MSRKRNQHRLRKQFASVLKVNDRPLDSATRQQLEGELNQFMAQRSINPSLPIPPSLQEHMDNAMQGHPGITEWADQTRRMLIGHLLGQEGEGGS